ncbi:hypothetical protein VTK56DRAFT_5762 [Thermocarpiscus australiensis]
MSGALPMIEIKRCRIAPSLVLLAEGLRESVSVLQSEKARLRCLSDSVLNSQETVVVGAEVPVFPASAAILGRSRTASGSYLSKPSLDKQRALINVTAASLRVSVTDQTKYDSPGIGNGTYALDSAGRVQQDGTSCGRLKTATMLAEMTAYSPSLGDVLSRCSHATIQENFTRCISTATVWIVLGECRRILPMGPPGSLKFVHRGILLRLISSLASFAATAEPSDWHFEAQDERLERRPSIRLHTCRT